MGKTKIFVKLLDENIDCWRPVEAIAEHHDCYLIVGPDEDQELERWEFHVGEVVRCKSEGGELVAVELVR